MTISPPKNEETTRETNKQAKIRIDSDRCSGHGQCYSVAASLFEDDEAGYGQVNGDGLVPDGKLDEAHAAVRACPEQAISLDE